MSDPVINTSGLEAFNKALAEYKLYNKRDLGFILENRAMRLKWAIYRQFAKIAPTKEKIASELSARGYAVKRRKGKDGKAISLKKEIKARNSSIKFLSVGFLLKEWKKSQTPQNTHAYQHSRSNKRIGEVVAVVKPGTAHPYVRLTSFLSGAVKMNQERNLVDKALREQAADMTEYVKRKQREALQRSIDKFVRIAA